MAIETWMPSQEPLLDQLTPFQRDLVTLRLDPLRPNINGIRELVYLVGKKWPGRGGDSRPLGWGWEQAQAYSRVHKYLCSQQQ